MPMKRAYSILTIKSIDEDLRVIEGIASTPTADRFGDVVEPMGAEFQLPIPLLWQHNSREPVGEVFEAKPTPDGIPFKARFAKVMEPGVLKDRLDAAWQSVKYQLVKGVSIGFSEIETSQIKDSWSYHFLKWAWLELSCVTIPANVEATITSIKSADQKLLAASGRRERPVVRLANPPGASGSRKEIIPKGTEMKKTIAEQISAFEAKRAASAARMQEIMEKAGETGSTLDAAQTEEYDTLKAELKTIDEHLVRLKEHEKTQIAEAKEVKAAELDNPEAASRARGGARSDDIIVLPSRVEKGIGFTRYVRALAISKGNLTGALAIAQNNKQWRDQTPGVEMLLKAAVAAGDTTTAGWASELVYAQNLITEFIEFLRPQTIIGRIPKLTPVPFNIRVGSQTSGSSAFWVGQGKPIPVSKLATGAVSLGIAKAAGLVVLDQELVRSSAPSAELLVRNDLGKAVAQFTDVQFVDPGVAAVANVSPASITNGVVPTAATGATAAFFRADLQTLITALIGQNFDPSGAVLIMTPVQALTISMMLSANGIPLYPGLTMNGGTLMGIPVVTSMSCQMVGSPVPTEGQMIILVVAPEVMLADDGDVTIDASSEAALEMLDNPTNQSGAAGPTATSMVSMFQTNSVAIKAVRFINWQKRRANIVAYIKDANYA